MIKFADVVDAIRGEQRPEGTEPFTWTTPIRHDPFLIAQLQRANLELRTLFAIAAQASRTHAPEPAADALNQCMQKLREVQRLEALRLYPVLAHHASGDSNSAATVAYLRLRAHTLSRRFLRLCESLMANCRTHTSQERDFTDAGKALDDYVNAKELQLYQAYVFTQTSPAQQASA